MEPTMPEEKASDGKTLFLCFSFLIFLFFHHFFLFHPFHFQTFSPSLHLISPLLGDNVGLGPGDFPAKNGGLD